MHVVLFYVTMKQISLYMYDFFVILFLLLLRIRGDGMQFEKRMLTSSLSCFSLVVVGNTVHNASLYS